MKTEDKTFSKNIAYGKNRPSFPMETQIIIKDVTFKARNKQIEVGPTMAAYLAHQISYFLMENFGVQCTYKVYTQEGGNNEIRTEKDQIPQGKTGN